MQDTGSFSKAKEVSPRVATVPFTAIAGQSKLFLEFLERRTEIEKFYPTLIRSNADLKRSASSALESFSTDRNVLCDQLAEYNASIGASEVVSENIAKLRGHEVVAVLTGQQAGLFSGPLYTIYKALSAIKMAKRLDGLGIKAVPVFWVATEDHDFDEISEAFVIDSSNQLVKLDYNRSDDRIKNSVGQIEIESAIEDLMRELSAALPRGTSGARVVKEISDSWRPGQNFGSAFASYLVRILGRFGLVMVDPLHRGLKRLASPIYVEAIRKSSEIVHALNDRGAALLSDGYTPQVKVERDYFPLFLDVDGERRSIKQLDDDSLAVKGSSVRFSKGELIDIATREPERLSPGVMLRPIVQDFLFPTVCYFGGSAEIAYFAQNSVVYEALNRPVTPILPRQSVTIVERRQAQTLSKYKIEFADLFAGEEALLLQVVERFADPQTNRMFADAEEKMNLELNKLDQAVSKFDITLAANLATRRRKILYHISALHKKFLLRRAERDVLVSRKVGSACTALFPRSGLQERTITAASFLDRHGHSLIDLILESMDLDNNDHKILYL